MKLKDYNLTAQDIIPLERAFLQLGLATLPHVVWRNDDGHVLDADGVDEIEDVLDRINDDITKQ